MLKVIFAPDWRNGVPYQALLAQGLERLGINVSFLDGYKRILPLSRSLRSREFDILHLHWPEAYYPRKGDVFDWLRCARFPFDLASATNRSALVTTAHNYHVHNRMNEVFSERNIRSVHERAKVVFAHSERAKQHLVDTLQLQSEKVIVIPHGDLSVALGRPVSGSQARCELGLGPQKVALVFGTIEPYKGLEEVISWWRQSKPQVRLAVVGRPNTSSYGSQLSSLINNDKNIIHEFNWLTNERLRLWLSAADVIVFNYREIFTSGAAALARSYGIPTLLPKHIDTLDLHEPTPFVKRFTDVSSDFLEQLDAACAMQPDFNAASSWRESCNWNKIASLTAEGYRYAIA